MNRQKRTTSEVIIACLFAITVATVTHAGNYGHGKMHSMDLVHTAYKTDLKTLVAAIDAADLTETLMNGGPFTVFAPTDEAFAALPDGTLESLLKPENKSKLASILTYHVVSGRVMAVDVVKLNSATTFNGQDVTIDIGDGVKVDDANVIRTDILAKNGVIHVIDKVILPN